MSCEICQAKGSETQFDSEVCLDVHRSNTHTLEEEAKYPRKYVARRAL
jgi:hypothetical protein